MGLNCQINLLDLHMAFKIMVKVKFKVIMTTEGHMKVKNIFIENLPPFLIAKLIKN